MNLTHCPSCDRLTPTDCKICPYCPPNIRRMQAFGCAIAYVTAFAPIILAILILRYCR